MPQDIPASPDQDAKPESAAFQQALASVESMLYDCTQHSSVMGRQAMQGLVLAGGKRMRPRFLLGLGEHFLAEQSGSLVAAAAALELTHCGTLLQDDVIDASLERRGQPTAFAMFGAGAGVLGGNRLYTTAFLLLLKVNVQWAEWLIEALQEVVDGEIVQQEQTWQLPPDEDSLLFVSHSKTGAFFGFACKIVASLYGTDTDAANYWGRRLGFGFQLADDLLDFGGKIDKPVCKDLREGYQTLPVFWAARRSSELSAAIKHVYESREGRDFRQAYDLIQQSEARAITLHVLSDLQVELLGQLDAWLPGGDARYTDARAVCQDFAAAAFYRML